MTQSADSSKRPPGPARLLYDRILGDIPLRLIHAVTVLDIPDFIAEGEQSVDVLADKTNVNANILYRVMRTLSGIGIFRETGHRQFALTPQAELLRSGVPGSLRNFVFYLGADWHYKTWNQFPETLRTGETSFDLAFGEPFFDHLQTNAERAANYNDVMTDHSTMNSSQVAQSYDFSQFNTLMDVGGGHGFLLAEILKATPALKGIVFDMPGVSLESGNQFEKSGLSDRASIIEGSFFETLPRDADGIIMKSIIHDWNDEKSRRILENCRDAVGPNGKVLLVEFVLPEANMPGFANLLDLEMLAISGGQERSEREFRDLFDSAGLRLSRVYPTRSGQSILEANAS
jgi:SAM-dependent methyltransferase